MDERNELTAIERALSRALAVDASPEFAARVRQRIAREPMRTPFWHGWRIAVPLAAAVTMASGVVLSIRVARTPDVLVSRPVSIAMMRATDAPRIARATAVPASLTDSAPRPRSTDAPPQPEVLVPREQIEMYRRLIAAAQKAPASLVLEAKPVAVIETVVPDMQIDPIRIDPLNPPAGGKGDRQ